MVPWGTVGVSFEYAKRLSPLYIATLFVRTSWGIGAIVLYYFLSVGEPEGTSRLMFGVVVAASPLAELVCVSPTGIYIDRHGRTRILLVGLGLGALSLFLFPLSRWAPWAFGVNLMHGVASAFILVSSLALMGDYAHRETRGREMGIFDGMNLFGWVLGFALGFALSEFFRWDLRWTFVVAGSILVAGLAYAWMYLVEPADRTASHVPVSALLHLLARRSILLLILPWFILYIVIGAVLAFLPEGQRILDIPPYLFALGVFGAGVGLTLSQFSYGKMSDKYGRGLIMLVGTVGLSGIMALVGVAFLSVPHGLPLDQVMPYLTPALMRFWPLLALFGACALAFGPSALASLVDHADEDKRGMTMSLYSLVITLGMVIGPIVVGQIFDTIGPPGVMLFIVAMGVCMLLLTVVKYLSESRDRPR